MSDQLPHNRKYCHLSAVNQIDCIICQFICFALTLNIIFLHCFAVGKCQVSVYARNKGGRLSVCVCVCGYICVLLALLNSHDAYPTTSGP